ncbi:type II secretion system GspH family protein [Luteimonas sp. BDR2-5]|uniref:type II secretion system protein n=1 Tax=Proluteimonas luteida TaxID=2878685 RepID=UPI001E58788A|nr:type II secretion system protein [Luteimonas sp. BDR2-5]MCD9026851.1 type II secretion system GspH family protein [Luteimonas sp. BDR2-5]
MRSRQGGFAYLYLLFTVAILAIVLLAEASLRHYETRRQAEAELIRIGREFRNALISYRLGGSGREFPASLDDLLLDRRAGEVQRHLRRIYHDPITRTTEWGLVRLNGRIVGIHSLSSREPVKLAGFDLEEADFEGARHYHEWRFTAVPDEAGFTAQDQRPGQLGLTIGP